MISMVFPECSLWKAAVKWRKGRSVGRGSPASDISFNPNYIECPQSHCARILQYLLARVEQYLLARVELQKLQWLRLLVRGSRSNLLFQRHIHLQPSTNFGTVWILLTPDSMDHRKLGSISFQTHCAQNCLFSFFAFLNQFVLTTSSMLNQIRLGCGCQRLSGKKTLIREHWLKHSVAFHCQTDWKFVSQE